MIKYAVRNILKPQNTEGPSPSLFKCQVVFLQRAN
jgi:hypothetical protein